MKAVRRSDREISPDEARAILEKAEHGILSTIGEDGQPYGVPLNYVYRNNCIYFHCALSGHKLDNIAYNPRVSFCVVGNTKVLADSFSTLYESALIFGVASEVRGTEKHDALLWLLEKYCPAFIEEGIQYIGKKEKTTKVMKIEIDHISGKARKDL